MFMVNGDVDGADDDDDDEGTSIGLQTEENSSKLVLNFGFRKMGDDKSGQYQSDELYMFYPKCIMGIPLIRGIPNIQC